MRLYLILVATVLACAAPAKATQEYILPTLFDVTGVEAGEVLNIRAAPSTDAEIIGTLDHDARNIEVVAHDRYGRWGQVNTRERSGWVSLRYLAYQTGVWEDGRLPPGLRCFGTEPFWSLQPKGRELLFSTPETRDRELSLQRVLGSGIFRDPRRALIARGPDSSLTAMMTPMTCSDGMSDHSYGLEINVIIEGGHVPELLTGCCSIQP